MSPTTNNYKLQSSVRFLLIRVDCSLGKKIRFARKKSPVNLIMEDSRAVHRQRQEVNFDYINISRYESGDSVRVGEQIE